MLRKKQPHNVTLASSRRGLLQEGGPVAYVSRKLRKSELNWVPIEKEILAIVFSAHKFREYILGKATLVQTDHRPLETILRKPMSVAPLRSRSSK